jgi:hypothetical protein
MNHLQPNPNNPKNKVNNSLKQIILAKYSKKSQDKVEKVMHEFKHGELKSGKGGNGGIVKSRRQAIAIGLSEARQAEVKVPKEKNLYQELLEQFLNTNQRHC